MLPTHFVTSPLPEGNGNSWTLVTRLGAMLKSAETQFGPRDQSWTILGVEFGPGAPNIWFPGDCKHIAVKLGPNALDDDAIACYQLAHECIHLLSPTASAAATVLEEGLATAFSEDFVLKEHKGPISSDAPNYDRAAALTRTLLQFAPDAIFRLRALESSFNKMTPETFSSAELNVPPALIGDLLAPFVRS